jgi:hypothetical protein
MRSTVAAALLVIAITPVCLAQSLPPTQAQLTSRNDVSGLSVWHCLTLIALAGALGGLVNTMMADGKFRLPRYEAGILCPGFVGNALVGAFAAVISWSLYGAGAGVDLARQVAESAGDGRQVVSLTVGALAGAALVGVGGARWLSNEVDTKLLRASVNITTEKLLTPEQRGTLVAAPAIDVLKAVRGVAPTA